MSDVTWIIFLKTMILLDCDIVEKNGRLIKMRNLKDNLKKGIVLFVTKFNLVFIF